MLRGIWALLTSGGQSYCDCDCDKVYDQIGVVHIVYIN